MLKKIFWSKWMTWFRKLLGVSKPDIDWEGILNSTPVYTLGSCDPRTYVGVAEPPDYKGYRSFSGTDVKLWIKPFGGKWTTMPEAQGISCEYVDGKVAGTIIAIIFDRDPLVAIPQAESYTIVLEAANEYGAIAFSKLDGVIFSRCAWGLGIDDIVTEMKIDYSGTSYVPWTSSRDHTYPQYSRAELDQLDNEGRLEEATWSRLDSY